MRARSRRGSTESSPALSKLKGVCRAGSQHDSHTRAHTHTLTPASFHAAPVRAHCYSARSAPACPQPHRIERTLSHDAHTYMCAYTHTGARTHAHRRTCTARRCGVLGIGSHSEGYVTSRIAKLRHSMPHCAAIDLPRVQAVPAFLSIKLDAPTTGAYACLRLCLRDFLCPCLSASSWPRPLSVCLRSRTRLHLRVVIPAGM
jgi:hypothetical protein